MTSTSPSTFNTGQPFKKPSNDCDPKLNCTHKGPVIKSTFNRMSTQQTRATLQAYMLLRPQWSERNGTHWYPAPRHPVNFLRSYFGWISMKCAALWWVNSSEIGKKFFQVECAGLLARHPSHADVVFTAFHREQSHAGGGTSC